MRVRAQRPLARKGRPARAGHAVRRSAGVRADYYDVTASGRSGAAGG